MSQRAGSKLAGWTCRWWLATCAACGTLGTAAIGAPRCELRPATLEDLYGDTGNHFQGAIGFLNEQARTNPQAQSAFGLAVDDVVLEWTEFTLDEDRVSCDTSGSCATIQLQQNNLFERETVLEIVVVDESPSPNDCNMDGVQDVPTTRDCNANGIDDVTVLAEWPGNPDGAADEILVLDRDTRDGYRGTLTISTRYDVPGTLFVAAWAGESTTVRVTYRDFDDGTGKPCQGSVEPGLWGLVQHEVGLFLDAEPLIVRRIALEDDGDHDGWADNSETVKIFVELMNRAGARPGSAGVALQRPSLPVTDVRVRMLANDPKIACITRAEIDAGDFAPGEARWVEEPFELVMAGPEARRTDALAEFAATVSFTVESDEYASDRLQSMTFDVDLDALGGAGPTTWFEGFESGFGQFTTMHIDETLNPPPWDINNHLLGRQAALGYRCQYAVAGDAAYCPPNCTQGLVCYPSSDGVPDTYYWHTVSERAFHGEQSLHYGVFIGGWEGYTTPRAQLEAIRTTEPVNLGWARVCSVSRTTACAFDAHCPSGETCTPAVPTFTFKHQISMVDGRSINSGPEGTRQQSADRGMVSAQLASASGEPAGDWVRLEPYLNVYDTQANTNYFNCTFDPIDDGSTEDDFFDPNDPLRSLGPSSSCFPNFNFAFQGSTTLNDPTRLGKASDGPGFLGAKGPGTWVEPAFDLSRFRGRRLRLRFLATGLKAGSPPHWHPGFINNTVIAADPRDDGWFIDDVTVTDALAQPATVIVEATTNPLAGAVCSDACTSATASARLDPAASVHPGAPLRIDASVSVLDRCASGVAQYRFWIDADRDGAVVPGIDILLRDWTQDSILLDAPFGDTQYLVEVRCATDPACRSAASVEVDVGCPGAEELSDGSLPTPFLFREPAVRRQILFADKQSIVWPSAATVDVVRGDLFVLRESGSFTPTQAVCRLDDAVDARHVEDATEPVPGAAFYYLVRSASSCNLRAGGSWGSALRDAEIMACP